MRGENAMNKKYILLVIGAVLMLFAFIKLKTGFYINEAPIYIGMLIAGAVCLYVFTKIKNKEDRNK